MPQKIALAPTVSADTISGASVLRLPRVVERTGLSRTTIYTLQKHNEFPKAIQLGGRAVGWLSNDIDQWLAERAAARKEAA